MSTELEGTPRAATPRPDVGAVVWIGFEPAGAARVERILGRMAQAVRADDRVCPVGTGDLAVLLGPSACAPSPAALGDR